MRTKWMALAAAAVFLMAGCGGGAGKPGASSQPPAASSVAQPVHQITAESEKLFHDAAMQYGKGNRTEALHLANEALEKDGENYKALSLKGIILAFDVSPDQGVAVIEKALEINPDYTQAFYDMAMAQKLGKHYDESISYFQRVLAADPNNTWSYYGIATNYADKHDKPQALAYLKKAMALDPANVRPEAETQDHFAWLRNDRDFQAVVGK